MEIIKVVKLKLEDTEIRALATIRDAHYQCLAEDCLECEDCSLNVDGGCLGTYAEAALKREEKK